MDWTFMITAGQDYFITSDCPVSIVNPSARSPEGGFASRFIEVTIPFSRTIALVTSWENPDTMRFQPASPDVIEQINRRTALRARVLIAPKPSFPGSVDITAQHSSSLPVSQPRVLPLPDETGFGIHVRQPSAYPGAETWLRPLIR
jgi:hypothetical protein